MIEDKIKILQKKLNTAVEHESLLSKELLAISQELDGLIAEYYLLRMNKGNRNGDFYKIGIYHQRET